MPATPRDELHATVTRTWGAEGAAWLTGLDRLTARLARELGLRLGPVMPQSFHSVRAVICPDGTPAVLKTGVPDGHLDAEIAALRAYDGRGAVRLLWADPARGALLLERAVPGHDVTILPDDDAVAVIAGRLRVLHTAPVPAGLDQVRSERDALAAHLRRFPGDDPLPRRLVSAAASLWCSSAPREVLLHGDLHHHNVLAGTREDWLAIDPHGRAGDPGYDCGQLLYNPLDADPVLLAARAPARLERLADTVGVDPDRALAWGFAVCVLSEVWNAQDGPVDGTALAVALELERGL
ncbi:Streptomycin 6-kinase (Streptidine kinase) (Streptomycin 6-phosphotransferase) (APH(6)) [Pseudonocardia sp. Ae168_Ps1]|uniref:aminoglycoside phosphotransferase family protein n=1 Tax=unclassified Pseudonocardia TaxID=2619320 RepID=UPI0009625CF5|nr:MULTISPECIES: aminoglycoside phosphotransferase family protein [unclassified Pseudonocardia]OLL74266.1 Streptomycin 6-kinase (Streptidine kinase) (Streptomycin 6-phosphotransferase) (APH(6)) [Pseudonocardia sp. Ae150A_Ps1]OLL80247.1 Streptomycin 6-kinase (Streptidine kinase) (Streptomycin 6-phosphotransferase) (APH(6)) [Pseudonocardia sp. Ae168_Ps1]OLL85626.1 Streptomycin 6-kinase (Streptidine kinase) (Streptomycin 6-phosphotransferase) (APH(6)) [Pseudonocardia sp. Ae263_Ps1]OLL94345.1 Strep